MTAATPPDPSVPSGQPAWGPPPGGQQPGSPAPGQWGGPPQPSSEDRTWALLAHLSIFVLGIIGPLVIYLVKKDESPFTRQHAAEALNFHITLLIASIVSAVLILVLIGILLLLALGVAAVVLAIVAAVAASKGQPYRYPLTWHVVS